MSLLPILAQGGFQLATSAVNNWFNRRAQAQSFKDNKAMSELAYKQDKDMWNRQSNWNREMWDLQNEYNLPANQMQRLRDAGLNPNLVAGQAAAGGTAGKIDQASMPKYSPARADYSYIPAKVPDMLSMYQNFKLKSAQIDNVEAQTRVAKEKALTEAELRGGKSDSYKYGNQIKYQNALYQQAFNELERDRRKQQLEMMRKDDLLKEMEIPYRKDRNRIKSTEADWLEKYGLRQQDPIWMRFLMRLFDASGMGGIDIPIPRETFGPPQR